MHTVLERNGQTALSICDCGQLHFHHGPMTLHFERDAFLRFADDVARLAAQFRQIEDGRYPALVQDKHATRCH
jgi:hypothetical protein